MICADGRITRFLAEGAFVSQEKEGAILHDRAAQREPGLHPRIGRLIGVAERVGGLDITVAEIDRKSTRLNSSHRCISYAVFCLKKKKKNKNKNSTQKKKK